MHEANRCRALFATHYHELTVLAERLDACSNASLRAREWQGDLVFLHEIVPGAADQSYGVQVAKLAGLPPSAIARARSVLARLEKGQAGGRPGALDDLPLFAVAPTAQVAPVEATPIELALRDVDADALSPREALDMIYALKKML